MTRATTVTPSGVQITSREYAYLLSQQAEAERRFFATQEELTLVAQDGTDDENPAFAQVKEQYAIADRNLQAIKDKIASATVVDPIPTENNCINEATIKVKLRCTYSPDEIIIREFTIGHELGNIFPDSPLFLFLKGKTVGYTGLFTHTKDRTVITSYNIEILDVEF